MTFRLGKRSRDNLVGVHHDLARVVELAIKRSEVDFIVLEGIRSDARQLQLYNAGASQLKSGGRHQTGHAVDLGAMVGNKVRWDWPLYRKIAVAMKSAAAELGVDLRWGGDWKSFPDGPHFELSRTKYPAPGK